MDIRMSYMPPNFAWTSTSKPGVMKVGFFHQMVDDLYVGRNNSGCTEQAVAVKRISKRVWTLMLKSNMMQVGICYRLWAARQWVDILAVVQSESNS